MELLINIVAILISAVLLIGGFIFVARLIYILIVGCFKNEREHRSQSVHFNIKITKH